MAPPPLPALALPPLAALAPPPLASGEVEAAPAALIAGGRSALGGEEALGANCAPLESWHAPSTPISKAEPSSREPKRRLVTRLLYTPRLPQAEKGARRPEPP